jgi:hypothetical protein
MGVAGRRLLGTSPCAKISAAHHSAPPYLQQRRKITGFRQLPKMLRMKGRVLNTLRGVEKNKPLVGLGGHNSSFAGARAKAQARIVALPDANALIRHPGQWNLVRIIFDYLQCIFLL